MKCNHKDHYTWMLIEGKCWRCNALTSPVKVKRDPNTGMRLKDAREIIKEAAMPF